MVSQIGEPGAVKIITEAQQLKEGGGGHWEFSINRSLSTRTISASTKGGHRRPNPSHQTSINQGHTGVFTSRTEAVAVRQSLPYKNKPIDLPPSFFQRHVTTSEADGDVD